MVGISERGERLKSALFPQRLLFHYLQVVSGKSSRPRKTRFSVVSESLGVLPTPFVFCVARASAVRAAHREMEKMGPGATSEGFRPFSA